MDNQEIQEQPIKKKRGRKPKNPEEKIYFGEKEEKAVVDYLTSESFSERNRIYNKILEPAFKKMIENLIWTFKLQIPGQTFEDTYLEALSYLADTLHKFNPKKGKKAYSYYGNCIKRHLWKCQRDSYNASKKNPSYDSLDDCISNSSVFTEKFDKDKHIAQDEIQILTEKIEQMVNNSDDYCLKPNEVKLGEALLELMDNWDLVISKDGSHKLNKSAVLLFLREQTGFDSKTIRSNLKKYRKEFLLIKDFVIKQY